MPWSVRQGRVGVRATTISLSLLALTAAQSLAQPIALPELPRVDLSQHTPPRAYEGQCVVRVRTATHSQLDALLAIVESVWSESTGVGLIDVQLQRADLPTLTKLGIGYDMLIEDLQAHRDARWQENRRLSALDAVAPRGGVAHDDAWFSNYKQFADIITYFNTIAATHPDIASMSIVGSSLQGNDIYALTITAPDAPGNAIADRPVVLWNGAQHAREWVSPMTVSYLASKLADDYGSDPRVDDIINNTRLVIVPVLNPDGYLYTWSSERYWRKNRRNNGNGTFGVDLNRNWGYEWGGQGASSNSADDTYHGTAPFSEPETQVLRDLSLSFGNDLVAHIDYHTYSQLILWPFGYAEGVQTPEPDRTFFDNLATAMSDEILAYSGVFYDPIQSVDLYPAAGASSDWFYGQLGVKSLTIELRPDGSGFGGFDPDPSIILPTARENYEAAKLFVERTTLPVSFAHNPVDLVQADQPTPVELAVSDIIETHDPSTVTLHARVGASGAAIPIPMTPLGDDVYGASLPQTPCGMLVHYAFSVQTTDGDTIAYPSSGEFEALAQELSIAAEDDMETNTAWVVGQASDTATTGIWNRMNPQGTDAQPEDDHTPGTGVNCWVTDGNAGSSVGANDIDAGATTLTSPLLDASTLGEDAELVYWRWYSNNQGAAPNEDSMRVEISDNAGSSWTTLEIVTENAGAWVEKRFRIADFVSPSDSVRVRFIASDLINGSIVEAGVDDLRLIALGCSGNPADLNGDGSLDFFDISLFLSAFNANDPIADFTGDGVYDFFDVSAFLSAFNAG